MKIEKIANDQKSNFLRWRLNDVHFDKKVFDVARMIIRGYEGANWDDYWEYCITEEPCPSFFMYPKGDKAWVLKDPDLIEAGYFGYVVSDSVFSGMCCTYLAMQDPLFAKEPKKERDRVSRLLRNLHRVIGVYYEETSKINVHNININFPSDFLGGQFIGDQNTVIPLKRDAP
ncbi:MAG: hypothetical protein WAW61_13105 [Methylococcaceae bacterium]